MKKQILLCLLSIMALTANAQFYVGGTLGVSFDKVKVDDKSTDMTSMMLVPELGYQFTDVISVGANIGFGYSDDDDTETTQFEFSPYIRANFAKVKNVDFFAEGALFINHSNVDFGDDDFSYNTYGAAVRPGFTVDLGKKVQLIGRTTLLQYSKAEKHDIDIKRWRFAIANDFTIGVLFNI